MSDKPHITKDKFASTFPHLVEGRSLLPKKRTQLQMLLLSTIFNLEDGATYNESQINYELCRWIESFGANLSIDHVTLRRYLVDEAILQRDGYGSAYKLTEESPYFTFDPEIKLLDLAKLVSQALNERAARKQKHLAEKSEL